MVDQFEAARLRTAAEERPLKVPLNRRIDERHAALTPDQLDVRLEVLERGA
jgi:hypothetical protein